MQYYPSSNLNIIVSMLRRISGTETKKVIIHLVASMGGWSYLSSFFFVKQQKYRSKIGEIFWKIFLAFGYFSMTQLFENENYVYPTTLTLLQKEQDRIGISPHFKEILSQNRTRGFPSLVSLYPNLNRCLCQCLWLLTTSFLFSFYNT